MKLEPSLVTGELCNSNRFKVLDFGTILNVFLEDKIIFNVRYHKTPGLTRKREGTYVARISSGRRRMFF